MKQANPIRSQALLSFLLTLVAPVVAHAQSDAAGAPKNTVVFERIFQMPRVTDPARVAEVKALKPGEKLEIDTNGDGAIDEAWYIDTDYRHNKDIILVRAVDEDGDYAETGRPDLDSDCYFWDWDADGYIDVVSDYVDDDGDNDVDQMGLFYNKNWKDGKDDMTVWWAVDIGDDNLLWYDVNGTYYQPLCQWRTHFSGDELFYQFRLTEDSEHWVNVWEDPFAFYDPDGDQCSEVVVRISAIGEDVKNLRYSIDADDDAYGRDTHNYDFSVTALPPEEGLSSAAWHSEALDIRGVKTLPVIPWDKCMEFGQQANWGKAMLTWDEINSNTDEKPEQDPHERWEGILNAKSKHGDFEQVGGPPSSPFNKRVEVTVDPESPLALYFDDVDQRLHLLGADYGYMDIDFDLDGEIDAAQTWKDEDNDGKLDVREIDVDADGAVDITQRLKPGSETYALEFEGLPEVYKPAIDGELFGSQVFINVATPKFKTLPKDVQDIVTYFNGPLALHHPETGIGKRIRRTPAGARFYTGLVRDRIFVHLRAMEGDKESWKAIETPYLAGDYLAAAQAIESQTGAPLATGMKAPYTVNGRTYADAVAISVDVHSEATTASTTPPRDPHSKLGGPARPFEYTGNKIRQDYVVSRSIAELRQQDPNFNPNDCVVVDEEYWLGWRAIPHQIDTWSAGDDTSISFVTDLPAGKSHAFLVCFNPTGIHKPAYLRMANAVLENPAYVAWESDAGAFRFYTGQIDFFGKQVRLLPRAEQLLYPMIEADYHKQQDWGIDALHVGKTSGLGGLTVYYNGKAYPVQSPAGEGYVDFEYKVLGSGPVRAGAEIVASNVFPEMPDKKVVLRCFSYAGRQESEVNVLLPKGLEGATVGIGLMDLEEGVNFEAPGTLGVWGRQGDDIGEIGLAVTTTEKQIEVKTLPEERHLICEPDGQHFRYWIRGGWRRGMPYPASYGVQNWQREVVAWAEALRTGPTPTGSSAE